MHTTPPRDEECPTDTVYPAIPFLRLRRREREPISPEHCLLGPDCLVCRWRREGLLNLPDRRAA